MFLSKKLKKLPKVVSNSCQEILEVLGEFFANLECFTNLKVFKSFLKYCKRFKLYKMKKTCNLVLFIDSSENFALSKMREAL